MHDPFDNDRSGQLHFVGQTSDDAEINDGLDAVMGYQQLRGRGRRYLPRP